MTHENFPSIRTLSEGANRPKRILRVTYPSQITSPIIGQPSISIEKPLKNAQLNKKNRVANQPTEPPVQLRHL